MRSKAEVELVLKMGAEGLNPSEISRRTGIARGTIRPWLSGTSLRKPRRHFCPRCTDAAESVPGLTRHAYAYLLGLYLGDGVISTSPRNVYRLRIVLDRAYPVIVRECEAAMALVMPPSRVGIVHRTNEKAEEVNSYSRHWPCLFPQHGPGPKHKRPIRLSAWQQRVVDRHPGRFLRGLIHSDGCRVQNKIRHTRKTYIYPRYLFSNRSKGIQEIFCAACDQLDVEWRQDGPWDISIARARSVAILDRHIGPKR